MCSVIHGSSSWNSGYRDAILSFHESSSLPTMDAIVAVVKDFDRDASWNRVWGVTGSCVVMFFTPNHRR